MCVLHTRTHNVACNHIRRLNIVRSSPLHRPGPLSSCRSSQHSSCCHTASWSAVSVAGAAAPLASHRHRHRAPGAISSLLDVAASPAAQTALDTDSGSGVTVAAWVVVAAATAASLFYMSRAFSEAKTAIERREEGERRKQQEDEAAEAARKQKIKDMFERL